MIQIYLQYNGNETEIEKAKTKIIECLDKENIKCEVSIKRHKRGYRGELYAIFGTRIGNALKHRGICNTDELREFLEENSIFELTKIRGFGKTSMRKIFEYFEYKGYL